MELAQVMLALEGAGTAQNRKVYARHGVTEPMFGVSYAVISDLARAIRTDHELAVALWATGNHDARVLATRLADPARVTNKLADAWLKDAGGHVLVEQLCGLIARSGVAPSRATAWRDRRDEKVGAAGWALTAALATSGEIGDEECADLLGRIEREIHHRPNRVRHEMNAALIRIGSRGGWLQREAIAAARRIGRVRVDHGATSCRTPDAVDAIERAVARTRSRAGNRTRRGAAARR